MVFAQGNPLKRQRHDILRCRAQLTSSVSCDSAALSLAAGAAYADPRGGVVTNGAATISTPAANLTQIDQTSHSVSIDWQSFDVPPLNASTSISRRRVRCR